MQLRTRITAIFVTLTALFQLAVFVFIFLLFRYFNERDFYMRLEQQALSAGQLFRDQSPEARSYGTFPNPLQPLPDQQLIISRAGSPASPAEIDPAIPENFSTELGRRGEAKLRTGERYYLGLHFDGNGDDFNVVVTARDTYGFAKLRNLLNLLILAFSFSLIILLLLGEYYASQALRPISRIIRRAQSIRAKNLHLRLDEGKGRDELAELARTFNNMLDRLEIAFDQQSRFINNASHELRNPLTAIQGHTEVGLQKKRSPEAYQTILKDIRTEALRLGGLIEGLLRLAQTDNAGKGLDPEPIRLDEVILEAKKGLDAAGQGDRIILDLDQLPEDDREITLLGSPSLLAVAFGNILDNACKYSEDAPVRIRVVAGEGEITVRISDSGIGIPPSELSRIFEPFYRASNARTKQGSGFGLPLAYRIVRLHGGDIRIASQPGKGTLVTVRLPNVNAPQE